MIKFLKVNQAQSNFVRYGTLDIFEPIEANIIGGPNNEVHQKMRKEAWADYNPIVEQATKEDCEMLGISEATFTDGEGRIMSDASAGTPESTALLISPTPTPAPSIEVA